MAKGIYPRHNGTAQRVRQHILFLWDNRPNDAEQILLIQEEIATVIQVSQRQVNRIISTLSEQEFIQKTGQLSGRNTPYYRVFPTDDDPITTSRLL